MLPYLFLISSYGSFKSYLKVIRSTSDPNIINTRFLVKSNQFFFYSFSYLRAPKKCRNRGKTSVTRSTIILNRTYRNSDNFRSFWKLNRRKSTILFKCKKQKITYIYMTRPMRMTLNFSPPPTRLLVLYVLVESIFIEWI